MKFEAEENSTKNKKRKAKSSQTWHESDPPSMKPAQKAFLPTPPLYEMAELQIVHGTTDTFETNNSVDCSPSSCLNFAKQRRKI